MNENLRIRTEAHEPVTRIDNIEMAQYMAEAENRHQTQAAVAGMAGKMILEARYGHPLNYISVDGEKPRKSVRNPQRVAVQGDMQETEYRGRYASEIAGPAYNLIRKKLGNDNDGRRSGRSNVGNNEKLVLLGKIRDEKNKHAIKADKAGRQAEKRYLKRHKLTKYPS